MQLNLFFTFNIDWTIYICSLCIYIIIFRQLARFTACVATFSKARQGTRISWSINNRDAIFDKRSREFKRRPSSIHYSSLAGRYRDAWICCLSEDWRMLYRGGSMREREILPWILSVWVAWARANQIERAQGSVEIALLCVHLCAMPLQRRI